LKLQLAKVSAFLLNYSRVIHYVVTVNGSVKHFLTLLHSDT